MIIVLVLMVIVAIAGAAILGAAAARRDTPTTISLPSDGSTTKDCDQACVEWDNARSQACIAKNDVEDARNRADGLRNLVIATGVTAFGLAGAAAAAFAAAAVATATFFGIPAGIVLAGIGTGLAIAAAAAFLVLDAYTAALIVAENDVRDKSSARHNWDVEVARLHALVNRNCPPDKANACLNRPSTC